MWSIEFLDKVVLDEMNRQPADIRAKFEHIVRLIEANGLERVREPYVKHLDGKLWEIRLKGRVSIARALYVTMIGKRLVIVRVFTKKSQKTPRREIELARKRAKDLET